MRRRLLTATGLCLGIVFAVAVAMPTYAQEKKPAAATKAKESRIDGTVKSIDKTTKTLSVRLRGKEMTRDVVYTDATKFTFRNKAATLDDVKDERRVICLGSLNDKGQLVATRIDVRDKM
jgi:Domain of unknown function (DUF5666)